jgi:uncharacterized LabA/DUF88 family protein
MNRIVFLIDGFNLYHSVKDASLKTGASTKWLNVRSLCKSYVSLFGKDAVLQDVYYFSAYAYHMRDPAVIARHKAYVTCLECTGVTVSMSHFDEKEAHCPYCKRTFIQHVEKETDIAIASKLFEAASNNSCDTVILMSGDTDLSPAVKTCRRLYLGKEILFAFPLGRKNKELQQLAPRSFKISLEAYRSHQFTNPFVCQDGTSITKPAGW